MANIVQTIFTSDVTAMERGIASVQASARTTGNVATDLEAKINRASRSILTGNTALDVMKSKLSQADIAASSFARSTSQLAPNITRAREEQERLNRSAAAMDMIRGRSPGGPSSLSRENQYSRMNLARQGGDVFTQLGSGQGVGLIAIQQGPQILEAMATAGGKVSTVLTAAKGALVAFGPALAIGAAGAAVVYKITGDIRSEAERRLKVEEAIAIAAGKQSKAMYDTKESVRQMIVDQDRGFVLEKRQRVLSNLSPEQLKAREQELNARLALGPVTDPSTGKFTPEFERLKGELKFVREQINIAEMSLEERSQASFDNRWQQRIREEQQRAESTRKGIERAKELDKVYQETFRGLARQAGADNPIAKVFFDADDALRELKGRIATLPLDMQKAALESQRAFNSKQLFGARLDSRMEAFELREQADVFRRGGSEEDARKRSREIADSQAQDAVNRYIRDLSGGKLRNLGGLRQYFSGMSPEGRVGLFDFVRQEEESTGLFRNYEIQNDIRRRLGVDEFANSAQGRLDRQLTELDKMKPGSDAERSLLDSRILSLGRSVDPSSLSSGQRERLATVAERMAERTERREIEALGYQKNMDATLKRIENLTAERIKAAQNGGLNAVNIKIQDDTGPGTSVELQRPAQADTDAAYGFGGFEIFGGTNR